MHILKKPPPRRDKSVEAAEKHEVRRPADYSYLNISDLLELGLPQTCRFSKYRPEPSSARSGRYLTRTVWLSNNRLTGLQGLRPFLQARIQKPRQVDWLDLSCNRIAQLDPEELMDLADLKILYLHNNCLDSFDEVSKLRFFKSLKIVTLYANPVEVQTDYRLKVIGLLPALRRLDYSPVTDKERFLAKIYKKKRDLVQDAKEVGTVETPEEELTGNFSGAASEEMGEEGDGEECEEEEVALSDELLYSENEKEFIEQSKEAQHQETEPQEPKCLIEDIADRMESLTMKEKKKIKKIAKKLKELEKETIFDYFQ